MKYCILRNECAADEKECASCRFYKSLEAFKNGWLRRKDIISSAQAYDEWRTYVSNMIAMHNLKGVAIVALIDEGGAT